MTNGNPSEISEEEKVEEMKNKEKTEIEDAESRQIYDRTTNSLRLQRRRAMDMKNNRRVVLPQARPASEEAMLDTRKAMWGETVDEFIKTDCDNKGRQNVSNITAQQAIGIKKLKKELEMETLS